jgi:predicted RNase H-like HicB family nuclease
MLKFRVDKDLENGHYVARCIELQIAGVGDTIPDALRQMANATEVHLGDFAGIDLEAQSVRYVFWDEVEKRVK